MRMRSPPPPVAHLGQPLRCIFSPLSRGPGGSLGCVVPCPGPKGLLAHRDSGPDTHLHAPRCQCESVETRKALPPEAVTTIPCVEPLKSPGYPVRGEGVPRVGEGLTVTAMRPAAAHLPPSATPDGQVRAENGTEEDLEGVGEGVEALVGKERPYLEMRGGRSLVRPKGAEEGYFTAQPSRPRRKRKTEGRLLCKRTVLFSLAKASFSRFLLSI